MTVAELIRSLSFYPGSTPVRIGSGSGPQGERARIASVDGLANREDTHVAVVVIEPANGEQTKSDSKSLHNGEDE